MFDVKKATHAIKEIQTPINAANRIIKSNASILADVYKFVADRTEKDKIKLKTMSEFMVDKLAEKTANVFQFIRNGKELGCTQTQRQNSFWENAIIYYLFAHHQTASVVPCPDFILSLKIYFYTALYHPVLNILIPDKSLDLKQFSYF